MTETRLMKSKAAPEFASGFPLAALFLLTTLAAILAGLVMQVVRAIGEEETPGETALVAAAISAAIGCVLGAGLGVLQRSPLLGLLVGLPVGFLLGAVVGPICLLKMERLAAVTGISLGGAVLLIAVALGTRWINRRAAKNAGTADDDTRRGDAT